MSVLSQCCQLIKSFEGFRSKPYQNPGDRPTIGWGNTFYEDGTPVTLSDPAIDEARAEKLLEVTVQHCLTRIEKLVTVPLNEDQQAALCSFEYNTGGLHGSTLLALLNAKDYKGAANQFFRWVHSGGVVDKDLVYRRTKEEQIFTAET